MSDPGHAPGPVRTVVARLDSLSERESLRVSDIVEAFGETAFLPVLMALALIVISPLSGIPLLSTFFGLVIAATSVQLLFGRSRLWLPVWLGQRSVSGSRLHRATQRLDRLARWLDGNARDRLRLLTGPPLDLIVKAACVLCGLAMPFLELVPFSSSLLATAVLLHCVALLTRDGLMAVAGFCVMAVAASLPVAIYGGIFRAATSG